MKVRPPQQEALLEEIRQIVAQYQAEVPGGRKAWPNAIKQRVTRLRELGISFKSISDQTGIPYFTVLGWRGNSQSSVGKFRQVTPDAAVGAATVAVATLSDLPARSFRSAPVSHPATATVAVLTPQGFRVEGLSLAQAIDLLGQLQ